MICYSVCMKDVVSIYEAKTHLSKLIKQASKGKTIYVGAYGQPQAVIAPLPKKKLLKIGIYADKYIADAYNFDDLVGSDAEIVKKFEDSIDMPFPLWMTGYY